MSNKIISFVIPSLNEEDTIGELLDSINRNTYRRREVIVVDGGSNDKTVEIAKTKGARVIKETGSFKCPANALNVGTRHTKGDIICIVGSDFLVPDKNFASVCVKAFDDETSAIYTKYRTEHSNVVEKIVSSRYGMSTNPTCVRRDVYLGAGSYPVIGVSEDSIFTLRVRKYSELHGLKEKFISSTFYSGHAVKTLGELFKQARWYGRTSVLFLREYYKETKSVFSLLKQTISINLRMIYFLSLLLSLLFYNSQFFVYPFLVFTFLFFITLLKNLKNHYNVLKVFTNLIFGLGFFVGLVSYLSGINRSRSRG